MDKRVWECKKCGADEWMYNDQEPPVCKDCANKGDWVRLTLKKGA